MFQNCVSLGANGVLAQTTCVGTTPTQYVYLTNSAGPEMHHGVWTFATAHPYIFAILVFIILELLVVNAYRFAAGVWNDLREERMRKQGTLPVEDTKSSEV